MLAAAAEEDQYVPPHISFIHLRLACIDKCDVMLSSSSG
jgi:hypothetical protein